MNRTERRAERINEGLSRKVKKGEKRKKEGIDRRDRRERGKDWIGRKEGTE